MLCKNAELDLCKAQQHLDSMYCHCHCQASRLGIPTNMLCTGKTVSSLTLYSDFSAARFVTAFGYIYHPSRVWNFSNRDAPSSMGILLTSDVAGCTRHMAIHLPSVKQLADCRGSATSRVGISAEVEPYVAIHHAAWVV